MFLDVVNSLPDAVLLVADADGKSRVEWANPAAGRLLGCDAEALIGVVTAELMTPTDTERVRGRLARGNAEPFRMDLLRRSDARSLPVDARVAAQGDRFSSMYSIVAREVREAAHFEDLLAELGALVLGAESTAIADTRALVRGLEPIFRSRRWSGSLWETSEDSAVLRHVISGWSMGRDA
jgi:hypothetical protein